MSLQKLDWKDFFRYNLKKQIMENNNKPNNYQINDEPFLKPLQNLGSGRTEFTFRDATTNLTLRRLSTKNLYMVI